MITEDYVSFETAKLLKDKGFEEWCFKCYGVAVLHNGADISFDEECELKDEGRENEIEYVEGGRLYDYASNNREKVRAVWAAPTLWAAMKWLREIHKISVEPLPDWLDSNHENIHDGWYCEIRNLIDMSYDADYFEHKKYSTYEEACEAAIKYCLEKLI